MLLHRILKSPAFCLLLERSFHTCFAVAVMVVKHIYCCVVNVIVDRCWTEAFRPQLSTAAESESTWMYGMNLAPISPDCTGLL